MNTSRCSIRLLAGLAAILIALGAAGTCLAKPVQTETFVSPFVPLHDHGGPLVRVLVDGRVTGTFMIDTGSAACIMTKSFADKLGIKPRTAYLQGGVPLIMGDDWVPQQAATLDSVQIGDLRMTHAPFVVIPDAQFFSGEQHFDGLIGGPILSQFAILIDYPRQVLAIIDPGNLSAADLAKLKMSDAPSLSLTEPDLIIETGTDTGFNDGSIGDAGTAQDLTEFDSQNRIDLPAWVFSTSVSVTLGSATVKDTAFIDTGSPITTIPFQDASRLAIAGTGLLSAQTVYNGDALYNHGTVDHLSAGTLALNNVAVHFPESKASDIPPLIGEDILSDGIALFDFPAKRLYFRPTLPPIADGDAVVSPATVLVGRLEAAAGDLWLFPGDGLAAPGPNDADDVSGHIASLMSRAKGDDSDAALYMKAGAVLAAESQYTAAEAQYSKAAPMWTAQLRTSPNDPAAQAGLAESLAKSGNIYAGEQAARTETATISSSPDGWIALAWVLTCKAQTTVSDEPFPPASRLGEDGILSLVKKLIASPLDGAARAAVSRDPTDARAALDKAVALAPVDATVYKTRAEVETEMSTGIESPLADAREGEVGTDRDHLPESIFADWDRAAQLSSDPDTIYAAIRCDVADALGQSGDHPILRPVSVWATLPKLQQQRIQAHVDHLTALSKSTDPTTAAEASSLIGVVQYEIMHDDATAESTLRAAIAAYPTCGTAVDAFTRMLSADDRYADIAATLTAIPPAEQTAQVHLVLARCYLREERLSRAIAEARLALAIKPDSYECNIMLAGMLLCNPAATDADMGTAKACLGRAESAIGPQPSPDEAALLQCEDGIFDGLTGDFDKAAKTLAAALGRDGDDTQARAALAALIM